MFSTAQNHKQRGNECFSAGAFDEALKEWDAAVQILRQNTILDAEGSSLLVASLSNASLVCLHLNEPSKALRLAQEALWHDPAHEKSLLRRDKATLLIGESDASFDKAEKLKKEGDALQALEDSRGQFCNSRAAYVGARAAYEKSVQIDRTSVKAYHNLGLLLADSLGDFEGARGAYEKAIQLEHPTNATKMALILTNYADLLQKFLGEFEGARIAYEKAIGLDPSKVEAYAGYGTLLKNHFNDYVGARSAYERAIEIDPTDVVVYNNYGNLLADHFNGVGARAAYETAIQLAPMNAMTYNSLATFLASNKDFEGARATFERSLSLQPNNPQVLCNFGQFLIYQVGNKEEGLPYLRRAVLLEPAIRNYLPPAIQRLL